MYSASTMGATIHMHYCMNQFAGWSFTSVKKENCAKCGMKNTGCCKDEKKQIKVSQDQQKAEFAQSKACSTVLKAHTPSEYLFSLALKRKEPTNAHIHVPPLLPKNQTQAFFSIFLI